MPDGSFYPVAPESTSVTAKQAHRPRPDIRVVIARGADDLMRCAVIRAAVWLAAPGARYDDHFNENDFSCTHLLVFVDDEPAGTLRLRWLAGEARFERLSIREEFRSLTLLRRLIDFAMALIVSKGYTRASGMTLGRRGLLFWQRRGAKPAGPAVDYHGEEAFPVRIELTPRAHPDLAKGPGHPDFEAALLLPESALMTKHTLRAVA